MTAALLTLDWTPIGKAGKLKKLEKADDIANLISGANKIGIDPKNVNAGVLLKQDLLQDSIKTKSLGKGSTGRTTANTHEELNAMNKVLDAPLNGAKEITSVQMADSRWLKSDGWVKMEKVTINSDGSKTIIHFNYNKTTGAFDDFKFK